jgi:hypothetical protein
VGVLELQLDPPGAIKIFGLPTLLYAK